MFHGRFQRRHSGHRYDYRQHVNRQWDILRTEHVHRDNNYLIRLSLRHHIRPICCYVQRRQLRRPVHSSRRHRRPRESSRIRNYSGLFDHVRRDLHGKPLHFLVERNTRTGIGETISSSFLRNLSKRAGHASLSSSKYNWSRNLVHRHEG